MKVKLLKIIRSYVWIKENRLSKNYIVTKSYPYLYSESHKTLEDANRTYTKFCLSIFYEKYPERKFKKIR